MEWKGGAGGLMPIIPPPGPRGENIPWGGAAAPAGYPGGTPPVGAGPVGNTPLVGGPERVGNTPLLVGTAVIPAGLEKPPPAGAGVDPAGNTAAALVGAEGNAPPPLGGG